MSSLAGFVVLGFGILLWLYIAYWVGSNARSRGSSLWPIHGIAALALGIWYALPYWLVTRNG